MAVADVPHGCREPRAAICVKISTDMPLPTPRSVINSPNHMMMDVPAVMVMIITMIGKMSVL